MLPVIMRKAVGALSLLLVRGVAESSEEFIDNRRYLKYIPTNHDPSKGLMVFLHGYGGSADDVVPSYAYDVERWSDIFGFLALIPDGSKYRGNLQWNMDPTRSGGEDDVAHILKILSTDNDAIAVGAAGGPKIALGFSNGAGMSSLLGCYDGTDLYVAHVAVHIDQNANFTEACGGGLLNGKRIRRRILYTNTKLTWNAVGETDFFLDEAPGVEGLLAQFDSRCESDLGDPIDCAASDDPPCPGFSCYEHPTCEEAGQLCVYENLGHEMESSMTATAWAYLTNSTVPYNLTESSPTPAPPGPSPPSPSPSCTAGIGDECKNNGNPCCNEGKCFKRKCT